MPARRFRSPSPTESIYIATRTQVVSRSSVTGTISQAQFTESYQAPQCLTRGGFPKPSDCDSLGACGRFAVVEG
jgi:hypothetical protein